MPVADLYTAGGPRDGGFVAAVPVPDFWPPPEVLVWGVRTFVRDRASDGRLRRPVYTEAFAYVVVEPPVARASEVRG